jgi:outer membrane protein insertion porin family
MFTGVTSPGASLLLHIAKHLLLGMALITEGKDVSVCSCRVVLGVLVLLNTPVSMRAQSFEGRRIVAVQYEPAGILDPVDLKQAQTLKVGSFLRNEDVSEEIDLLFATGEFTDIRADAEASGDGVKITFFTVPTRYVASMSVEGRLSESPSRGELARSPRLAAGHVYHDRNLKAAADSIQHLLISNGLYEAAVTPEIEMDPTGRQAFLQFQVRPGKRAKYETPDIHGDTKLSMNTVLRATGWRIPIIHRWRQVTEARTRNGVQGLVKKYENTDRLRARVELNDLKYDAKLHRVHPTLTIAEGPKVEVVATEAKVSKRVLKRYVPVFQERTVDNDLLAEGARNLRDYFQSLGYFDTTVDFRTLSPQDGVERIEYAVSQGQRYKLVRVEVTGNKYFNRETIREHMFLEPASFYLRRGRYSEAFEKRDEESIANLYRSNGFHDVKVTAESTPRYNGKQEQIGVVIRIEEGPQWLVESVELQGVEDKDRAAIEADLASMAGEPFSEVSIAADRNSMLDHYSVRGYAGADVQGGWQVVGPQRVKVLYKVQPGRQEFVRDVLITGLNQTRRKLVEERIKLKEGDPLSPVAQQEGQKNLYDMGVFARVDTAIENPEGSTTRKTVLYAFEEANRYTVSLGVGAQVGRFGTPSSSSLAAPAGSTGFSPLLSVNVSRLNFLGIGHTISALASYSSQQRFSTSYYAPRFLDANGRSLVVTLLYDETRDVRTFSSKREEASVQMSQKFSRSTTGLLRFAYRRVAVNDVIIPVLLVPQFLQTVRVGIVSANLARDRRDNSADPHHGSYNTADIGFATKYLGSQRSFGRALIRNATYYSITRNIVFARQTQFGVIAPFSAPAGLTDQESVPLPERFFGGGADSLRAFPYNQAGPRDTGVSLVPGGPSSQATGFPLGGNALVFNNAEIRFPLIGQNIQGVFFHDIGNVYSTVKDISFRLSQKNDTDFNYAVQAAGMGVRYKTPIGPVRADFAYTINPPAYQGFGGTAAELLLCGSNGTATTPGCQSSPQQVSHFQFFFSIGQTF